MATITDTATVQTIATHYIDGEFVPSHGREDGVSVDDC